MKEQSMIIKKYAKRVLLLSFLFLLLLFPLTAKKTVQAQSVISISTGNYVVGEWTNTTVMVSAEISINEQNAKLYFSLDSGQSYFEYTSPLTFATSGEFLLEFKAVINEQNYFESISIKIDKIPAVIERVEVSETEFTTDPVTVFVILADSSNQKEDYRASFFGKARVQPVQDALSLGLIMFTHTVEKNTIFGVGDVVIYDQAGNTTVYNEKIEIFNIEGGEPEFNLKELKRDISYQQKIELELGYIASHASRIFVQTPSGELLDLQLKQKQTFVAKQNGLYIFTVVSSGGYEHSRAIIVRGLDNTSILIPIIVATFSLIAGAVLFVLSRKYWKNKRETEKLK